MAKTYTGAELGRIAIENAITNWGEIAEPTHSIQQEELTQRVAAISIEEEARAYSNYIELYNWLVKKRLYACVYNQQALLAGDKLLNNLYNHLLGEQLSRFRAEAPQIMTKEQYNNFVKNGAPAPPEPKSTAEVISNSLNRYDNGIAVIQDEENAKLDEDGNFYIYYMIDTVIDELSVNRYFKTPTSVLSSKNTITKFCNDAYFVICFNKIIEIIAKKYKIKEIELEKINLEPLFTRIEAYNRLVGNLEKMIDVCRTKDEEAYKAKLAIVKQVYQPIDEDITHIPESRIRKTRQAISNIEAFQDNIELSGLIFKPYRG